MVLLTLNDDFDPSQVIDSLEVPTENHRDDELLDHHLSLNAYHGFPGVATICFSGTINGTTVQVLLDGGSSNNYITPRVAMYARLPVEPTTNLKVLVGNGMFLKAEGFINSTPLYIQGHLVQFPAYVLPVWGAGIILGASWLATIGSHIADYRTSTIKFYMADKFITLVGDQSLTPTKAHYHHFKRMTATYAMCKSLYKQCFTLDTVYRLLVSQRSFYYLKDGVNAVKERPYRYPVSQKTQIEKMVTDMLTEEHQLYANFSKCQFGQQRIEYLGHIVTGAGVEMDPLKITDVKDWPVPSSVTQLRAFLGLTGYYRRFIHHYASIAHPLTNLLRKDHFKWSLEAQSAFDTLKKALISAHVLRLHDFSKPFIVETDASGYGIGAILSQDGLPIAFFSKNLSKRIQQTSAYVRKLYAITEADRVVVPPENDELLKKLLVEFHSSTIGGHAGFLRTYARIATYFYWPGMRRTIREFVRHCQICQRAKSSQLHPAGLLSPLPIPNQVWEDVAMDFINVLLIQKCGTFVQKVVKLHGIPLSIISYRDRFFTSGILVLHIQVAGNVIEYVSAYHPQLMVLYGRDPPSIIPCSVFEDTPSDVQTQLQARDVVLAQLKINIARAQAKMKKYADKKRRELEFVVGDFVYVKLQLYRQLSVKLQRNQKLDIFFGPPFQVVQKIGSVAYKLALPLDLV
ncbi:reverse transcriptase [Tanacetum coccineum]|uniref:Reverse transcriptase n=1 Tax=Tanacetum coccineum TaxID=301880 RepID=A0ABQ5GSM9_9ASTR